MDEFIPSPSGGCNGGGHGFVIAIDGDHRHFRLHPAETIFA
ncbi:MAG: hypothetical protein U1F87_09765 [Kiritimatiellia bacterium]